MIVTLAGLFLYFGGWEFSRRTLVPVAYLFFMIPLPAVLWNGVAFPLQIGASKLTAFILEGAGMAVLREGNLLHLPRQSLEVVEACSGLRFLTSLLALSAAFAYFASLSKIGKGILFSAAVPAALLANVFRLTLTAAAGEWAGIQITEGVLHDLTGMIVFGAGLLLLGGVYLLLRRFELWHPEVRKPSTP
jgi:exosortase